MLDFRNRTEDIVEAFEQFHGCTVAPPTDPNILWDTRRGLDNFDVLRAEEIDVAMPALLAVAGPAEQRSATAYATLAPSKGRYEQLADEERAEFRTALTRFVRPTPSSRRSRCSPIRRSSATTCSAARSPCICATQRPSSGLTSAPRSSSPTCATRSPTRAPSSSPPTSARVRSFFGEGKGVQQQLELETLSSIVEQLNDRFGTDLTDVDKLLFDQFEETWATDGELSDQAQNNSIENFRLAFDRKFMQTIVTRMDDNSEIFKKILDDDEFSDFLRDHYLKKVYAQLRDVA